MPIPTDFSTPQRLSAKKRAFLQIQEWIIDGTLKPKEKLNDADLAEALGVSRTPIREALQLLGAQGFVEMFPGVGTQVTTVNHDDIMKILPPLSVLQALATEIAAEIIDQQSINQLKEINEQFSHAIKTGNSFAALKLDVQFHDLIVEKADNPYITQTVSSLQPHVLRLYFYKAIILTESSIDEHNVIIKALEEKDKETCSRVARTNWIRAIDEYFTTENKHHE
ncbi:GntR family transcriptional regulator [Cytobacillus purgationiresistens]|uniref:DNA-binding GntR family transcriptional regulator n=1 Tax=Cytobacillus purgationiresistens TaxID=863449 RepID=A0ABU0ACT2_9BACI|nr:GntR family transcriptional regulator [Cytobacillus purgationiresistens]MDQ0268612.1 DNA-binding GntR family transcriptional regulator [Cytobacillus purgationiresistens]